MYFESEYSRCVRAPTFPQPPLKYASAKVQKKFDALNALFPSSVNAAKSDGFGGGPLLAIGCMTFL